MENKECKDCKKTLPISEFYPRKQKGRVKLKVETACKKCTQIRCKKYRENNPDKYRSSRLKSLYGVNLEQYKAMAKEQENKCKVCNIETDILCVDHCHETGNIRGLLCKICNKGLGVFKDSPELLRKGASYIEESRV